jgi:hypothetical protein
MFQESGYLPAVSCIYNASATFILTNDTIVADNSQSLLYAAQGCLPNNSNRDFCTWDLYPGYSTGVIVAITAGPRPFILPHMIGIAAGSNYTNLNSTQCTIDYQPTLFNVTVGIPDRNITVTPLNSTTEIADIEPIGYLTFMTTNQFRNMAMDQTSLWSSSIGNSFNASIDSYVMWANATGDTPNATEASLTGLENSVAAMIDDMLVAFASAQIMIVNDTKIVPAIVVVDALQIGEAQYIWIIVLLNTIIFLIVGGEALRTRGWHGLTDFNYMDPRNLVIGSSRGGSDLADVADDMTTRHEEEARKQGRSKSDGIDGIKIMQEGSRIVLGNKVFEEWI